MKYDISSRYHLPNTCLFFLLIKIKVEIDAFERTKDEESKKFKSHNIDFDFNIVTRIKELMVDLSSSCMELALKVSLAMPFSY